MRYFNKENRIVVYDEHDRKCVEMTLTSFEMNMFDDGVIVKHHCKTNSLNDFLREVEKFGFDRDKLKSMYSTMLQQLKTFGK
jgi:hypothetical protein